MTYKYIQKSIIIEMLNINKNTIFKAARKIISLAVICAFLINETAFASGSMRDCLAPHLAAGTAKIQAEGSVILLWDTIAAGYGKGLGLDDIRNLVRESMGLRDDSPVADCAWADIQLAGERLVLPQEGARARKIKTRGPWLL